MSNNNGNAINTPRLTNSKQNDHIEYLKRDGSK